MTAGIPSLSNRLKNLGAWAIIGVCDPSPNVTPTTHEIRDFEDE